MQRTSVPAVKSRLMRGRERLRRWYERYGHAPAPMPSAASQMPATGRAQRLQLRPLAAATGTGEEGADE